MNRSKFFIPRLAIISTAAALCTACGPSYAPISQGSNYSNLYGYGGSASGLLGNGNGTATSSTGSTTTTTTTTTTTGTAAPITESISGVGYTSTSVTVSAASVLKMIFTPGIQQSEVSGTGYSPNYSMLGVYITVNGSTQNTGMLSNGLYSAAESSPVLDFSSTLSGSLQAVTITVGQPNNDYFCLNFGYYCPWTQVYTGQPWNGTLEIQTDSTIAITSGSSFI